MKKIVFLFCWLFPTLTQAQNDQGITFQVFENWQQLLTKAKAEHKNIFIDAYATWCGPCKKMDAEVYTDQKIGALMNTNYIAVKVQFDQSKNDNNQIKSWYTDAEHLMSTFHIDAFPTLLFLTPDGQLIYKDLGYKDVNQFANLIKDVNDPALNYSNQIASFKAGKLKYSQLLRLSLKAKEYKDSIAIDIAKTYKTKVLDVTEPTQSFNKEVRDFMVEFQQLFTSKDKVVRYIIQYQSKSDQLLDQKGFAKKFSDYLITKTEIDPMIMPLGKYVTKQPDWFTLERKLKNAYGNNTAYRLLVTTKYNWYTHKQDWPNAVKYTTQYLDMQGIDTATWAASGINGIVFTTIFMHSDDPKYLRKGMSYMEIILKAHPEHHTWIDTYANLLYKSGKKEEAIQQEQRALTLATDLKDENRVISYRKVLEKMHNNQPTWE
ncbi:hypothetical protein DBR11_20845 [Pedobacter sp. HMWF019]|uniref:DUF255 domain-containing protein n=1 Tax=Pedobacter sp. HMWF019 TaxID=2056856 RepID=UPI000D3933EC|nr:DUF255 domain-containing protein [Pedobacter sp. HMWF019]PTS95629.1 hypothetical protein DBR11_20845 [Pedobacter sp. HMWF019]